MSETNDGLRPLDYVRMAIVGGALVYGVYQLGRLTRQWVREGVAWVTEEEIDPIQD